MLTPKLTRRCFAFLAIVVLCYDSQLAAESESISAEQTEFFEKKIRPVLVDHCYECHAADAKSIRGGLRLDSAAAMLNGGDSGPAVVPGEPSEGTLLDALKYETFEMPPRQKLPNSVIQDFVKWIEMGAPDPRTETQPTTASTGIDLEAGREFWSFTPIQKQEPPAVGVSNWVRNNIDHFILAAQRAEGLEPASVAEPLVALRRLYYDIIGLPPTAEQIGAFLSEPEADRWNETVDRLLASQQFGERWGRHWLDLARYSNSTGGGRSLLYGESWRYRNYVIDSFNADKPFDQFIREQIAGDLLNAEDYREQREQLIATGFLALGPHNYENQDKEQLRMDVVDEQIDTVGRVFLGMTIGCARCHDHKFDPIPTTDYYALAGIFRSTNSLVNGNVSRWVSTPLPTSPAEATKRKAHTESVAKLNQEIQSLQKKIEELKTGLPSILYDNTEAKLIGEWTESTSVSGYVQKNYQHSSDPTASAAFHFEIEDGQYEVQISYTPAPNRTSRAKVLLFHDGGMEEFSVNQKSPPQIDGTFHSLGSFALTSDAYVLIQPTENAPTIIDAVRLISLAEDKEESTKQTQLAIRTSSAALKERQNELEELKKAEPGKPPEIVSVEEHEEPSDYNVCIRGNPHNLGRPVERGFLSVVTSPEDVTIGQEGSGRLELANWIANQNNPLTARVFVNRVWKQLFNVGLVRTVDNFGVPGESPSHPELLDHLAYEFMVNGWSVKRLIREIVVSQTYQLESSTVRNTAADPENRLLTHQNRKRLTAEAIHDAMLQASGELDFSPAEKTVRPGTKSEYGYRFDFGKRAVYLPVFRNQLADIMSVFDFPNPNMPQGKRTASNISPQSLFLMNSDFVRQRSQKTAERVMTLAEETQQRIEWLTLTILNRAPTDDEVQLFSQFIGDNGDSLDRWTQVAQSLFGSLDFRFVD